MTAHLLVVEDEYEFGAIIQSILKDISPSSEITMVRSRDAALPLLENEFFDLIILDLKIPASDDLLDTDPQHGFAVFARAQAVKSGTPLFVLTGSSAEDFIPELVGSARQLDVWGEGRPVGTVDFLAKHKFDQFPERIKPSLFAIDALAEVELDRKGVDLSIADDRLIRIFSKKFGATRVVISALGGGLSGAKVLRLRATDAQGALVHDAVAKLGTFAAVTDEGNRFDNLVSRLEARATPRKLVTLEAGAGLQAGVFYALASGFNETAFEAAVGDPVHAATAVVSVEAGTSRWREGVPQSRRSIADVRRRLLADDRLAKIQQEHGLEWVTEFESKHVQVKWCCAHGDLHGENVLVAENGSAVLIDYGDVGEATACLDPVTLELSLLFHPKSPVRGLGTGFEGWPTLQQAEAWGDLEAYLVGCPVEPFIRACRTWSNQSAVGQREVAATAYSYLVRQLKYDDTNKDLALAILRGVNALYNAT